jgi:hypothetical protein
MNLKHQLFTLCVEHLQLKAKNIKQLIDDAIEAANDETKSSAGDKYETGMEMMQQEIELNVARLGELTKQREMLDRVNPDLVCNTVQHGALVRTNNGYYYVAIAAGQLKIGDTVFYAISHSSPAGEMLMGKKKGDEFLLNGKTFLVEEVL